MEKFESKKINRKRKRDVHPNENSIRFISELVRKGQGVYYVAAILHGQQKEKLCYLTEEFRAWALLRGYLKRMLDMKPELVFQFAKDRVAASLGNHKLQADLDAWFETSPDGGYRIRAKFTLPKLQIAPDRCEPVVKSGVFLSGTLL